MRFKNSDLIELSKGIDLERRIKESGLDIEPLPQKKYGAINNYTNEELTAMFPSLDDVEI